MTFQKPVLRDPMAHLLALFETSKARWLIGLGGFPGSGKSTLAAQLAQEVNNSAGDTVMAALSMDGFHLTQAELRRMPDPAEAFARRGAPWTFDVAALAERLRFLKLDGANPVDWPDFQHETGDPVEAAHRVMPSTRLILVEGLYLLQESADWQAVSQTFDERWYLDIPLDLSLERLVSRHMVKWGLDRASAEARVAANDQLNADIVWESRLSADWWIRPFTKPDE